VKRAELELWSDIGFYGGLIAFVFFGVSVAACFFAFVAALEARARRKGLDIYE